MPINVQRFRRLMLACVTAAPLSLAHAGIELELLDTYSQPDPGAAFDESAAEIVAFDKKSERLFVTNGNDKTIDILDISDPADLIFISAINMTDNPAFGDFVGGGANSVAVSKGLVAVAVEADTVTDPGIVAFFDTDGNFLSKVTVGALPDMLTFTPDGKTVVVANEGEPHDDIDPEGSVSIIEVKKDGEVKNVMTADFNDYDDKADELREDGVRLFPDVANAPVGEDEITVSQDLEPEYIAVDGKGKIAMVALQEANALAVVDIKKGEVKDIQPLGTKDHSEEGFGLDPSDRDEGINIDEWPVLGLFLPDAIASYEPRGKGKKGKGKGKKGGTFYITANEGDDRGDADEDERGDAVRFKDIEDVVSFGREGLALSEDFEDAAELGEDDALGRLNISTIDGLNEDGELEQVYSYGARSFTIWDEDGELVWDSGDMLEQITAAAFPASFNASNDENEDALDDRSDNKGPEPEAVTVAEIDGEFYALVGLERIGGFVIYNVTDPEDPEFVLYENNRDFSVSNDVLEAGGAGDLGPESILFIDEKDSPEKGVPLIVVANEVSGTTTTYAVIIEKKGKGKKGKKGKK